MVKSYYNISSNVPGSFILHYSTKSVLHATVTGLKSFIALNATYPPNAFTSQTNACASTKADSYGAGNSF